MSVSQEVRDETAWAIRRVLREHGESTVRQIAKASGVNPRRITAVGKWMVERQELLERQVHGRRLAWRFPGQRPGLDLRHVLEVADAAGVAAHVAEWHGRPRVTAKHPLGDGMVWLDCEADVEWYVTERLT